mgnify:CR=1 FL=1
MTINNRHKLQTQVALGRSVYDVLSEILRTGDTIDELDRYILQKMQFTEKVFRKRQEEEEEKAPAEDPTEIADNAEAFASGPAVVEVTDTMESVEAE